MILRKLKQKNDGVTTFEFLAKNFENFMNDLRSFEENQDKIMKKYQSMEGTGLFIPKTGDYLNNPGFSLTSTNMYDSNIKRREFKSNKTAD